MVDVATNSNLDLKTLDLSGARELPLEGLKVLGSRMKNVKVLRSNKLGTLRDHHLDVIADSMPCLEVLDISYPQDEVNVTDRGIEVVSMKLKVLRKSTYLDISMGETNLGGGGGDKATNIVSDPRIKFLNFGDNPNLSDECLAKLASTCPTLEVLDVSSCKGITEKGIADSLKSNSKIRKLRINECGGIMNIGNGLELPELEVLEATRSGINDDGLVVIGNRCDKLFKLNLNGCLGVTTVGLKEILRNCKRLRNLNLTGCLNMSLDMIDWMVFSRPSLRTIILSHSSLPSESQRELLLRHGCLVFSE
ncbi:hypothetical protein RHSIM_RhsimUnG0244400 [Rhododendron simsii]|uniref:Uncharacterized protein n=1 Tax=Rhododendron simsii TaxID=118357 RepID=A0A834L3N4_RHOSS|nr:hypothetical protein RHSIM_RhsimUnG0244400 [Rhododendron simsii]